MGFNRPVLDVLFRGVWLPCNGRGRVCFSFYGIVFRVQTLGLLSCFAVSPVTRSGGVTQYALF